MSIEQSLSQAPLGLNDVVIDNTPAIEIEIENPEGVKIGIDGVEIDLMQEESEEGFSDNLAEYMNAGAMDEMAGDLAADVDQDKQSRKEWEKAYVDGLKLLGLQIEERTEPWQGACGVFHPMITEAVVRFQAETITETFPAQGPVRTKIIGKDTVSAMQSGIFFGYVELVRGMVRRFKEEIGEEALVIGTGGYANLIFAVDPSTYNFGTVSPGQTKQHLFTLQNAGYMPAGSLKPASGASRPTACCEKYCTPQPMSPDHSSRGADG
mgnify:CR=1 FL=1